MMQAHHPDAIPSGGLPNGPASSLGEGPYRASGTSLDYMYAAKFQERESERPPRGVWGPRGSALLVP